MLPAFEKSVYVKCVYSVRKFTFLIMFTLEGSKFQTDDGIYPTGSDYPFEFCHHLRPFNRLQSFEIYVKGSKSSLHIRMKFRRIDQYLTIVSWKIVPFAKSFSLSAHRPSRNSAFRLERLHWFLSSFPQSAEKYWQPMKKRLYGKLDSLPWHAESIVLFSLATSRISFSIVVVRVSNRIIAPFITLSCWYWQNRPFPSFP